MSARPKFAGPEVEAFRRAKIIGVRAGGEHRPTGVWVVVVDDRVFVRSWDARPNGWYRSFLAEPGGSAVVDGRELEVRAVRVRSARTRGAVSEAFAGKYDTKASQQWVKGFAEAEREAHTLELVPGGVP